MEGDWREAQKRLLIEESDAWFDRHGMRLQLLRLPLSLPPKCRNWADVAEQLQQHPLHLKLLNHQRLLAKRIKANWSFSASVRNCPSDPRNRHLPFRLQPLPRAVAAELQQLSRELLCEDFDGLLLTVHSKQVRPKPSGKNTVPNTVGLSKVFGGCLIESLASNERQLRALWVNHRLSARSTRLLLQVLLPRAVVEAFALEAFTYVPSSLQQQQQQQQQQTRFGWPLHYDIKGKAAAVHLDAGVSESLTCSCQLSRTCLRPSEQATVDRFLMVTEPLLHLLLPPRAERRSLNIDNHPLFCRQGQSTSCPSAPAVKKKPGRKRKRSHQDSPQAEGLAGERKGWREFIGSGRDEELAREAACLLTGSAYSPPPSLFSKEDEWCGLTPEDVLHLVSDCEQEDSGDETRGAQSPAGTQAKPSASGRQTKPQKPNCAGSLAAKTPQHPPAHPSRPTGRGRPPSVPSFASPRRGEMLPESCSQQHASSLQSQPSLTHSSGRGSQGPRRPCAQESLLRDSEKGLTAAGDGLSWEEEAGGGVRRSVRVSKKSREKVSS
ncbi:Conserved Plasmodium protein, related [Eimeria mitis]|uniref:Conserved Plasmodium protein, related n=1 Tax=Eimeria mitis TaxID=44415 RepID=U6KG11_9EIME|nr:Conserved Plasmodium protein, related [Eimeria mitis]CDJ34393.1 Conserved Plasmodium protein, related [Eimeria mitis]